MTGVRAFVAIAVGCLLAIIGFWVVVFNLVPSDRKSPKSLRVGCVCLGVGILLLALAFSGLFGPLPVYTDSFPPFPLP